MPIASRASACARCRRLALLVLVPLLVLAGCSGGEDGQSGGAPSHPGQVSRAPDPTERECGAQAYLAPRCGALWGVYTLEGPDPETAVYDLEQEVGRRFDVALRFHDFSYHPNLGQFPDDYEREMGRDRTLFFSWQARVSETDTDIPWRDIANGDYDDDYVRTAARRIREYGEPVFLAFDPEFDRLTSSKGPVEDYAAAYRRVWDVFEEEGVDNVAWAWVPTGYVGADNEQRLMDGYPGDDYVDWVGYDPYNFYECNGTDWEDFEQTIEAGYAWLERSGLGDKPIILSEYGTQYDADEPERSQQWHRDIPEVLERYPNLKGLVRFDADGVFYGSDGEDGPSCGFYIDNGPGMAESFAEAGLDPYVNTRE